MRKIASAGSVADGSAGLRKQPPLTAVFRGIGMLPNKQFSQKTCNRLAYYIACRYYQLQTLALKHLYFIALLLNNNIPMIVLATA